MNQESDLGELAQETVQEDEVNDDVPLLKIKQKKARPPLTDKQKEALKKGQQKRLEGVEIKRAEKVLKAHELLGQKALSIKFPQKESLVKHKQVKEESETEEEEAEVIYKKKASKASKVPALNKPKKKKKTIIVYESSSASGSETCESDESIDRNQKYVLKSNHCSSKTSEFITTRPLKSQQNNKNSIQMHNERQVTRNFFCD